MGCDYYTQTELVIEYVDINGELCTISKNTKIKKGYFYVSPDYDSDDEPDYDDEKKYKTEIQKIIEKNTFIKVLYVKGGWIKMTYAAKYINVVKNIDNMSYIVKVYKKYSAYGKDFETSSLHP